MTIFLRGPLLGSGDGQTGENDQRTVRYHAMSDDGTDTEIDAEVAAWDAAPADWGALGLSKVSRKSEELGAYQWYVDITYRLLSQKIPQRPQANDPTRFGFDTSGAVERIKSSLQTVTSVRDPAFPAADFGKLINVVDGTVEGVDIVVPQWVEPITRYLADAVVTSGFRATIYGLTGKVNSDTWRTFQPGEVLFRGATGERRPEDGVWEITYRFEMRPNRTDIEIGGDVPLFNADGQDFVWARTAPVDSGAGLILKPTHAYVERVYKRGAFAALGIT
jgi:hypothetical protein